MDNEKIPGQEENDVLPLELTFPSEEPVIEPLSFEEAEIPLAAQPVEDAPIPPADAEPEAPAEENAPVEAGSPPEQMPAYAQPLPENEEPAFTLFSAPEDPEIPDEEPILTQEELAQLNLSQPPVPEVPQEEALDQEYRDTDDSLREIGDTPLPEKRNPARKRPARKGRPKKVGGEGLWGIPSILVTVVWLALIIAIGVTAGRMVWVCAADVLAFGREDKPVTVTVYEGESMEQITEKLYDAGIIRYRSLFNLYADFSHAEEKIKPGFHDLNTRYDYHALVNVMSSSGSRTIIKVMIPEGFTCAQIFSLLEENKIIPAQDLAAYAATGELDDYWFLENVERGQPNSLEGFLFPDTYEFYKNDSPRNILQKMLNNFDNRFDEDMRNQIDGLNDHIASMMRSDGRSEEYIADHLFTVKEVTTVASMIEKETAHSGESPLIASVIYNRLFRWGSTPAYLNIDASIVYALNGKTNLTREDLQVDSPYNTYLYTGLTPTPIANPGLTSLKAALNPETTDYYFYVLNPAEGSHQFSTTREEHEGNVTRFAEG